jgi:RHS repeat-associated protein
MAASRLRGARPAGSPPPRRRAPAIPSSLRDATRPLLLLSALLPALVAPGCSGESASSHDEADPGETAAAAAAITATAPTAPVGATPGTFSLDARGGASYAIPITVPPGLGGIEPKLSLNYSSWGQNGTVGMRFSLAGLSTITRCARTMAQDGVVGAVSGDANDRFCLDGQRLIAASGADGGNGTEYRTEIDGGLRVYSRGTCGAGPCSFDATDKHGNVQSFGATTDARLMMAGGTVGAWGLSRVTSPNATYLSVSYLADSGQIYPQQILYTLQDSLPSLRLRRVAFSYEARADWDTRYLAGTRIDTKLRLNRITTSVDTPSGTVEAREYRLGYASSAASSRSLLQTLSECDAAGACLPPTTFQWQSAAAQDFAIVEPTSDPRYQTELRYDWGAYIIPGDFNGDGKTDFIRQEHGDWANDTSNNFNVYFSNGDGTFNIVTPPGVAYQTWLSDNYGASIIPGDFNGDGKADFIRQEHNGWANDTSNNFEIYFSNGDGTFKIVRPNKDGYEVLDKDGYTLSSVPGHGATPDPNAEVFQAWLSASYGAYIIPGDFNGDGKTDFIRQEHGDWANDTSNNFNVYLSRGDGTFDVITPPGVAYQTWLSDNYGASIIPGDFNGDGKTDFIRQEHNGWANDASNNFEIYFSNGDGTFKIVRPNKDGYEVLDKDGYPLSWVPGHGATPDPNAEVFQAWLSPNYGGRIIPGDFNGDGKTDFLRQEINGWSHDTSNNLNVYFSRGDGTFDVITPPGDVYQAWLSGDYGAIAIPLDYNGDGKTDFIRQEINGWSQDASNNFNVYVSRGDGTFNIITPPGNAYQYDLRHDDGAYLYPGDFDGDGKADFIRQEHGAWDDDLNHSFDIYFGRGSAAPAQPAPVDQVTTITTGLGGTVAVHYAPILSTQPASSAGRREELSGIYVVDQYTQGDGRGGAAGRNVTYGVPAYDSTGRGFLGFDSATETSTSTGITVQRTYTTSFPYTGLVATETVTSADGTIHQKDTHTWADAASTYQGHLVHQVSITQDASEVLDHGQLRRAVKGYLRDGYGNVVLVHDYGNDTDPSDDFYTCTTFAYDTTNWRLDYPSEKIVAASCSFAGNACTCSGVIEDTRWQYGNATRMSLLSTSRWESGSSWQTTSFTYDALGNPLTRAEPSGATLALVFDADYQTFPVTETRSGGGLSLTTTSSYDPRFGARVATTDPAGGTRTVTLDGLGREVAVSGTAPGGGLARIEDVTWSQDSSGTYRQKRAYGDWQATRYRLTREYLDGSGRVYREVTTDEASSPATTVDRAFDEAGRTVSETLPYLAGEPKLTKLTTYDALGREASATSPNGKMTMSWYVDTSAGNGCSARVDTTDTLNGKSSQWLDARGNVIQRRDADGRTSTFAFDALGRMTRASDSASSQLITYDGVGRITGTSSADRGNVTSTYTSGKGQLASTQDADGNTISYLYDGLGRVTQKSIAGKQTVAYLYDQAGYAYGAGRLTGVTITPWGQSQPSSSYALAYTADGHIATRVVTLDGATYTLGRTYDPAGRVTSLTYPDGKVLSETYDSFARLTALSMDGVNYLTQGGFLGTGQPTSLRYGSGTTTTYTYDAAHRLASALTVGPGNTTLLNYGYTWDAANRITQITDNRTPANSQSFIYSPAGYLMQASSTGLYGTLSYGYDSASNLVSKEGAGLGYAAHRVVSGPNLSIAYSSMGDRTSQTKNGVVTTYAYDGEHHLASVTTGGVVVNQFAYDFEGTRVVKIDADGTKTHYVAADFEVMFRPDGSRLETKYVTGPAGRVAAITNPVPAGQTALLDQRGLDSLGSLYDRRTLAGLLGFARDRADRWSRPPEAPAAGAAALALALAFGLSRLARRPFARRRLARLRAVVLPAPTAWSRRHPIFAATVPVVLVAMLSACGRMPMESTASTDEALTAGANGAGNPVNGTYYFHQNHLGSSSVVTNASGVEVARAEYKPYGEIIDAASPGTDMFRAKFTGKEWDKDSGLYYSDARYYDPATGRFITADTHLFGGPESNAASLNPYAYAGDNPVVYTDPSGHSFLDFLEAVAGVVVGAFMGGMTVNGTWDITKWNWKSWKTWVGILAGAASGMVGGELGSDSFGKMLLGSIINNTTMEGLQFLSDDGNTGKDFGINVALGVATDVAMNQLGAAIVDKGMPGISGRTERNLWKILSGTGHPSSGAARNAEKSAGRRVFDLAWSGAGVGVAYADPVGRLQDNLSPELLFSGLRSAASVADAWRASAASVTIEAGSSVMLQLPQPR